MMLPVYIPEWQIGDRDIPPPMIGQLFDHVLLFTTDDGVAADYYGKFGCEVALTGTAFPLVGHEGGPQGAFPTELRCEGFSVYWSAAHLVSGPLSVTGILHADDYGTSPEDFPRVQGTIISLAGASLLYVAENAQGISWVPAPGRQQVFRPIGSYPPYSDDNDSRHSSQLKLTGYVADIDTSVVDSSAPAAVIADSARPAGRIVIRIFPDYANTVLWLVGPLPYEDALLTPELTAALQEWEASYYAALTPLEEWRSLSLAAAFTATGSALAQRLADELGTGFAIEFHSYEPRAPRRIFTSDLPATNPAAASVLAAIVEADAADKARLEALSAGDGTGWFAYAPLSDTYFTGSYARSETPND